MTRADRLDAALERWEAFRIQGTIEDAFEIGNEMARLLRESQPEPVVGDDDAALLAKTQDWLCHNLTVTPDSHYRNVQALLERCSAALSDLGRVREDRDRTARDWNDLLKTYDATVLELTQARAALAAAVAEEREACAVIAESHEDTEGLPMEPCATSCPHAIASRIRARAGRNDAG